MDFHERPLKEVRYPALTRFALFHEVGTGKTMTCIGIAGALYQSRLARRVLVVCPSSVVSVWPAEFKKWADYPVRVHPLSGPVKKRSQNLLEIINGPTTQHLTVVVTNYEATWRMEDVLAEYNCDLIICDEAHRLKSHTAKQSGACQRLGLKSQYAIAATGTPVANLALDLFGIYSYLDPSVYGKSFTAFRARYAHTVDLPGGAKMVTGMRQDMLADLAEKAHSIAHRATKADALDLPDTSSVNIPVTLEPKARKLYDALRKDSIALLESGDVVLGDNVLTRVLRLQQITGGFAHSEEHKTVELVSEAKMKALTDLLSDLPGKTVVFCRFTAEIKMIQRHLEKTGVGHVVIDGSVPMGDRGALVEKFQSDAGVSVFLGQIQAAGEGITLTASSSMVFYSTGWGLKDYEQACGRIHRPGQHHPCTYYHLVAESTIDERVVDALREKRDVAQLITDDWRTLL